MPIHGEYRQLAKHARLAEHLRFAGLEETFVMESGETLEIDHHGARKGRQGHRWAASASIPARSTTWCEDMVIRDRRHLSEDGIVLPIIAINKHTGRMREPAGDRQPRLHVRARTAPSSCSNARQVVAKTLEGSNREERTDWGVMKEKIRADLKRFIIKETSRRPLIMPVILEV